MGRKHKQISAEPKELLKNVLSKNIRKLCGKETSNSDFFFAENLLENMEEAK